MNFSFYIQKFDLKKFLLDNGVFFIENKNEFTLKCPNCASFKKPKLNICKTKKIFNCFRCGTKGSLVDFICFVKGCSKKEAIKLLLNIDKPIINDSFINSLLDLFNKKVAKEEKEKLIFLPDDYKSLSYYNEDSKPLEYIKKRNINEEHIDFFEIGYSQKMGRIIFPIFFDGELVGWQGRTIIDGINPKALTCPGFDKSKYLYNYDNVLNKKEVVLCEGPIDCIKSYKYNSIALLGKKISKIQLNLLISLNLETIYLGLDNDAISETNILAKELRHFVKNVKILEIDEGKDLGDATENDIERYINNAKLFKNKDYFLFLDDLKYRKIKNRNKHE